MFAMIRILAYEFRVTSFGNEYRLFYIYDGETIVILLNCYMKKTRKALDHEIDKALRLKKEYYESKRTI